MVSSRYAVTYSMKDLLPSISTSYSSPQQRETRPVQPTATRNLRARLSSSSVANVYPTPTPPSTETEKLTGRKQKSVFYSYQILSRRGRYNFQRHLKSVKFWPPVFALIVLIIFRFIAVQKWLLLSLPLILTKANGIISDSHFLGKLVSLKASHNKHANCQKCPEPRNCSATLALCGVSDCWNRANPFKITIWY